MKRHKTIISIANNDNILISFYPLNSKKITAITESMLVYAQYYKISNEFRMANKEETNKILQLVARDIPFLFLDKQSNYVLNTDIVNSAIFFPRNNEIELYSGRYKQKIMNIQKSF